MSHSVQIEIPSISFIIFIWQWWWNISFLEWLHSLAHRCSLWKHKCWIPSYSERSRRQLQSKGRELWTNWKFHYSSKFCLDYFEKLQRNIYILDCFSIFFFQSSKFCLYNFEKVQRDIYILDCFLFFQNNITPLHVASRWGKPNMVTLLLDNHGIADERTRVWIWNSTFVFNLISMFQCYQVCKTNFFL